MRSIRSGRGGRLGRHGEEKVIRVSNAARSHSEDLAERTRRYVITQSVRVICFVGAVALPLPLWLRLVLIGAGMILPLMGVVAANAGPIVERPRKLTTQLPRAESPVIAPAQIESSRVIDHES